MGDNLSNRIKAVQALSKLVQNKPLDDVSVAEICETAGFSRQTFYRIFDDKYAVTTWFTHTLIDATVRQIGQTLSWEDGFGQGLRVIERNAEFMRGASTSRDYNSVFMMTVRSAADDLTLTFKQRTGHAPEGIVDFQIHAFARIATICITEWLDNKCPIPSDTFSEYMLSLVPRELFTALEMESVPNPQSVAMFLTL